MTQTLTANQDTTVELVAGQVIYLNGDGIVTSGDDLSYIVRGWPITVGPFTKSRFFALQALAEGMTFDIRADLSTPIRFVQVLTAALPAVGEAGVIYETEDGWKRWEDIDGTYKVVGDDTDIALVPVIDTEPVIAGDAEIGAALAVTSDGVWDYRPTSFAYQWYIQGDTTDTEIENAVGSTLDVGAELVDESVFCTVIATNAAGDSDPSESNVIGPIVDPEA